KWVPARVPAPDSLPTPTWADWDTLVATAGDATAGDDTAGAGAPVPDVVVLRCGGGNDPAPVHAATHPALAAARAWLADPRSAESTLLVTTRGAAALPGEDVTDLAGAAAAGLIRTAQAENPGRIVLADIDHTTDPASLPALALHSAPGPHSGETQ